MIDRRDIGRVLLLTGGIVLSLLAIFCSEIKEIAFSLAGGLLLIATSGFFFNLLMSNMLEKNPTASLNQNQRDTGRIIGKCENVLVYTFIALNAYTALGLVFAAKSIVRKEDIDSDDTSYYLTGTLVNFTYSIGVALLFEALPKWL